MTYVSAINITARSASILPLKAVNILMERLGEEMTHTNLERVGADARNGSLRCKLTGSRYHSSCYRMEDKAATAMVVNSQFNFPNDTDIKTSCNGAARATSANFLSTSPVASLAAFGAFPSLTEGSGLGSGHPSSPVLGTMGASPFQSQAQPRDFDVQLSEVCRRRFVMFDHSGSKRRMIFHPAMMKEFSALMPSNLQMGYSYNLGPLPEKGSSGNATIVLTPPCPGAVALVGASLPHYSGSYPMSHAAATDSLSSASDNCGSPPVLSGVNDNTGAETRHLDSCPELSCFSHENTEDIEALLNSDEDEVSSTGHSPSDLTRNDLSSAGPCTSEGHGMCTRFGRKRAFEVNVEDDTCSTATSGNNICKYVSSQKSVGADSNQDCIEEGVGIQEPACRLSSGYNLTGLGIFIPTDEMSSSSGAYNKKCHMEVPGSQHQQQRQLPAEQSRKEKIKGILRLLRGIIPGGESMDTAFVLDEAIQYVRTLQSEVQKLQARKLTEVPKFP